MNEPSREEILKILDQLSHFHLYRDEQSIEGKSRVEIERRAIKVANTVLSKGSVSSVETAEKVLQGYSAQAAADDKKASLKRYDPNESLSVKKFKTVARSAGLSRQKIDEASITLAQLEKDNVVLTENDFRRALEKHFASYEIDSVQSAIPKNPFVLAQEQTVSSTVNPAVTQEIYTAPQGQSSPPPITSPQAPAVAKIATQFATNQAIGGVASKLGTSAITKAVGSAAGASLGGPGAVVAALAISKAKDFVSWMNRNSKPLLIGMGALVVGLGAGILGINPLLGAGVGAGAGYLLADGSSGVANFMASSANVALAAASGMGTLVIGTIIIPITFAMVAVPIIIALILFIINSGAYLVPPSSNALLNVGAQSPYIDVKKTASPSGPFENGDPDLKKITYTITITAKKGGLSNIKFENVCRVTKDGVAPPCDVPNIEAPATISPTESITLPPYEMDFSPDSYNDSFVTDTFTVTADSPDQAGAQASATATVKIGDPPEECPSGWPVAAGSVLQGAYTTGSHKIALPAFYDPESIDIPNSLGNPVFATHAGIVKSYNQTDGYGKHVRIQSSCNGTTFISLYAHLSIIGIESGETVEHGQEIGRIGSTGNSGGPHIHYEFKVGTHDAAVPAGFPGKPAVPYNPPYMLIPYVPKDIPRGCYGNCNVTLP